MICATFHYFDMLQVQIAKIKNIYGSPTIWAQIAATDKMIGRCMGPGFILFISFKSFFYWSADSIGTELVFEKIKIKIGLVSSQLFNSTPV